MGFLALASLLAAVSAAAPSPGHVLTAPTDGRVTHWEDRIQAGSQSYRAGPLTLVLTRRPGSDDDVRPGLAILEGGKPAIDVLGAEGLSFALADFAVARFDTEVNAKGVLFMSYTGGAHCCERLDVVEKVGGAWRTVTVGEIDMGVPGRFSDVDGDGVVDIVANDNRFDYAFASFAGSYAPPTVYNLSGGKVKEVSAEPRFHALFEKDMARAKADCLHTGPGHSEINGACAAFVADAARLGRFDTAWPVMLAHYDHTSTDWPRDCKVALDAEQRCPKGQELIYKDYPTALRAFLVKWGYLHGEV